MRISDWSSDVCSSDLCLARLVFALEQSRSLDGRLLTPLGAARKQDDQLLAVLHQIEPVARSPIDPVFAKSAADPFAVRPISEFEPQQPCRHFRRLLGIAGDRIGSGTGTRVEGGLN